MRSTAYKKQGAPDRRINILLIYSCYQYMKSKGHLYIYLHLVHPACKRRKLQSLGVVVVIGLGKTSKII
jgi:hypothetical protein